MAQPVNLPAKCVANLTLDAIYPKWGNDLSQCGLRRDILETIVGRGGAPINVLGKRSMLIVRAVFDRDHRFCGKRCDVYRFRSLLA